LSALLGCGRIDFDPIEPVFDLDFTRSPGFGFERKTPGTVVDADGLIRVAGLDEPRFDHDPFTGAPRGLLIEGPRTNLLERTEDLSIEWFTNGAGSVMVDRTRSPDGTMTADEFFDDDAIDEARRAQLVPLPDDDRLYTYSVFVKASTMTLISFESEMLGGTTQKQASMDLDLADGSIREPSMLAESQGVIPYRDGWYRVWMTIRNTSTGNDRAILSVFGDRADDSLTGSFYAWGAQIEQGELSSYIPSLTNNTLRDTDFVTLVDAPWVNSSTGTLRATASVDTTTGRNPVVCLEGTGPLCLLRAETGLTAVTSPDAGIESAPWPLGTRQTITASWENGTLSLDDRAVPSTIPTFDHAELGLRGTFTLDGHLERVTYWSTSVPQ
jgi:hypothetical protein